jgi:Protein of unknown function (DUF3486)
METASPSPEPPQSRPRISTLPRAVRDELNRRLLKGNLSSYASLSQWLKDQGYQISPRSLAKYGDKLERRLETVKMATEQARAVVDMTEGDDATLNEALLRLVQQHLFAVLVELTPEATRANLSALTRCVAEMSRASIMQKKFADEMRTRVEARLADAAQKVVEMAKAEGTGLTAEAEDEIRRTLMEITQ